MRLGQDQAQTHEASVDTVDMNEYSGVPTDAPPLTRLHEGFRSIAAYTHVVGCITVLAAIHMGSEATARSDSRGHRFDVGDRSWEIQANCLGVDPDLFFPGRGANTREAKAVCRACVVREDCLEYALVNGEKFGIWGGLSERERRRLRRQRALVKRPAATA